MEAIESGHVYQTRNGIRWQILSVDGETAHAVRVRKADGETWIFDRSAGRDFPLAIIREHWTRLA